MKKTLPLLVLLALFAISTGCSRIPVRTREIHFYRADNLNGGLPCAVDVIYPKDQAQLDKIIKEIGPEKWFTSDLYDVARKEKVWLKEKKTTAKLKNKDKMDPYIVIFPEFTKPDKNPPRGREPYLLYQKVMKPNPKAKKVEFIYVHEGSLERLKRKPKEPVQ